jgi:hypothetical protein
MICYTNETVIGGDPKEQAKLKMQADLVHRDSASALTFCGDTKVSKKCADCTPECHFNGRTP